MIIDSHHHLWRYMPEEYGWMDDSMQVLKRDYLPVELESELLNAGVDGTVVVQARQSHEETRWLLEMAGEYSFIKGVVGWVDLCSPMLIDQLEKYAAHPKLVGVRHVIHDEPDDDFMLRDDFRQGISVLQTFNLAYDLLLFPKHLDRASELARAFPRQFFVLDHLAKPPIKSGAIREWKEDLEKLAARPNTWCKLSGMVTEADHQSWKQADLIPYMEHVLNVFGTERVMLGSDWPVCTLAGSYQEVMGIGLEYISKLSETEQKNIKYLNAIRSYQLQTEN